MKTTCQHCTAPTGSGGLCSRCQHTARRALFNASAYHADLFSLPARAWSTVKSHRMSDPTGSAVALSSARDHIDDEAAETRAVLLRWVRRLVRETPRAFMPNEQTVEVLARVLTQQLRTIATLEWAGEFVRDVVRLERRLRKVIEANKGLWYAGVCGHIADPEHPEAYCTRVLYADPAKADVRCPVCGTVWPVSDRRRILLEAARDEVTNVATIARACAVLLSKQQDGKQPSQAQLEARIQKWADRGKIERRGSVDLDGHVRKVYRVGDVLDLLFDTRDSASESRSA